MLKRDLNEGSSGSMVHIAIAFCNVTVTYEHLKLKNVRNTFVVAGSSKPTLNIFFRTVDFTCY